MAPTSPPPPASNHAGFPFVRTADGRVYVMYEHVASFCEINPEFVDANLAFTLQVYYQRACAFRRIAYDATTEVDMIVPDSLTPESRAEVEAAGGTIVHVSVCNLCFVPWTAGHVCAVAHPSG